MRCSLCVDLQIPVSADVLANESLPHCVEHFEDLGYFGDDLDGYHLKKCPECGSYFSQHDWDHFEEGGGVGTRIERIEKPEAAGMIPKIIEKVKSAEWLQSHYDVKKIRSELERLESV